jgi:hypothetical protein
MTGDHYTYHLFYIKNQAVCSSSVGGCYLVSPFVFCAYHGNQTIGGFDNLFSIQPWQQVGGCESTVDTIQNDNASTLSHELSETLTDPHLDAWFNSSGEEIGDICRETYGSHVMNPNAIDYTIQEEWMNSLGACAFGP